MERQFIVDMLKSMIGKRVRIHIRLNETAMEFGTQLAVVGVLEGSVEHDNFRVMSDSSDPGASYSYFQIDDISCAADRSKTDKGSFNCGALAAFYLKGIPVHPYHEIEPFMDTCVVAL